MTSPDLMVDEAKVTTMGEHERRAHAKDRVARLQKLLPEMERMVSEADHIQRDCILDQHVMLKTIIVSAEKRHQQLGEHLAVEDTRGSVRTSRTIEKLYVRGVETHQDGRSCFDQPTHVFVEKVE